MRISIVTPSLNQGAFIERTLESVHSQRGDFELEHLVIDGGSTDETPEILARWASRARVVREPDGGQSEAINKGFRLATGEVLAWLNSDDTYLPGALDEVARTLGGGRRWCFGGCRIVDEQDRPIRRAVSAYKAWVAGRYSRRRLLGRNFIPQPATFFRRDLLAEAGALDESLHYAMDYDLWLRFAALAEPSVLRQELATFRMYRSSKTIARSSRMIRECFEVARRRSRPRERLAVAQHAAHAAVQLAVYRAYGAADAVVSRRR